MYCGLPACTMDGTFVLRRINLYYGRTICTTDGQFLLRTTSIVGTPVLRAKTINIWYDCIIKLMNILSARPEWIFPTGDSFVRRDTNLYYGRSPCTTDCASIVGHDIRFTKQCFFRCVFSVLYFFFKILPVFESVIIYFLKFFSNKITA